MGDTPDARFFQRVAGQGHYKGGGPYGTEQGAYVIAPSGILLGSTTLRGAEDVASVIRKALARWKAMPRAQRLRAAPPDPRAASARRELRAYPEDGLVLDLFARDLPGDDLGPAAHRQPWNQDHVWFTKAEVEAWVPPAQVGARRQVPEAQVLRLARLGFIDVTHGLRWGEPPVYGEHDAVSGHIEAVVEAVDGPRIALRLEGSTASRRARSPARGVSTRILGRATWDSAQRRFTAFELLALGTRWGANWLGDRNDRAAEKGPQPIGYWLELAGGAPRDRVPPEYLDWYDHPPPEAWAR